MQNLENRTVRDIALASPAATRVFEEFKIDYCCHGEKRFSDACEHAGVSLESIRTRLKEVLDSDAGQMAESLVDLTLSDLMAYIIQKHHVYTKSEIRDLTKLMEKVVERHGALHPKLFVMQGIFHDICDDLSPHMMKEEVVLFPYIAELESATARKAELRRPHFGSVENPIGMMKHEHETVGDLFNRLREVADNYAPPAGGCVSFQTLYRRLADFELDIHQHIHLENNVLFPRALELDSTQVVRREAAK